MKNVISKFGPLVFTTFIVLLLNASDAFAQSSLSLNIGTGSNTEIASAMKIFFLITLLSLAPAILLTMTSFTRIIIVLSFLRQALGVQSSPPNQVVVGLALFLTLFVMSPVISNVNENAIQPFFNNNISQEEAFEKATIPIKTFMFAHTRKSDLQLLFNVSNQDLPKNLEELSLTVAVPAFILSELKTAFEIGFLIYLPFVLIDMVVAMVLLTMGMLVLPPVVISMPFKLMLFVLVDGWNLVIGSLMGSFK